MPLWFAPKQFGLCRAHASAQKSRSVRFARPGPGQTPAEEFLFESGKMGGCGENGRSVPVGTSPWRTKNRAMRAKKPARWSFPPRGGL
jgi:hypothetical protein